MFTKYLPYLLDNIVENVMLKKSIPESKHLCFYINSLLY